ncbi:hypothetical protein JCM6882_000812 [Rhodosporidiobolus microsporus]
MAAGPARASKMDVDDPPVASTSKQAAGTSANGGASAEDVKPKIERSPGPDRKGKRKAVDEDDAGTASEQNVKDEDEEDEKPQKALDPNEEILIGTIPKANIVGLKYAGGVRTLKLGMEVQLRRDPQNVSDSNAIEVRHPGGLRIGYVAKGLAGRFSPMIKERKIRLEGVAGEIPPNSTGLPSVPMSLSIYGKRKFSTDPRLDFLFPERREKKTQQGKEEKALATVKREQAEKDEDEEDFLERMRKKGQGHAGPDGVERSATNGAGGSAGGHGGKGGGGGSGGGSNGSSKPFDTAMAQAMALEAQDRQRPDLLGAMFKEGEMDPAQLPLHPDPPGKKNGEMKADLLPFQRQGLAWMIKMEHPELPKTTEDKPVQLWAKKKDVDGKTFWFNIATGGRQREKPVLKRGGILADEMGLGKTMQTISLICTDDTGEGVLDEPEEPDERFDDMTLIVCPLSVASNWTDQLQQHVGRKRLKWHFYHGEGRELSKKQLREYDVVIATYNTLAGTLEGPHKAPKKSSTDTTANEDEEDPMSRPDPKKQKKAAAKDTALHAIKWRRVVLDEGHLIKNPKAKMSRACADLKAERRWILTGTPIVNAAGDLGAMIQFLRMCKPLDDPAVWRQHVGRAGDEASKLLRAVVLSTTLRRTKDMVDASGKPLIRLPQVSFYQHKVQLKPAVRELYAEVEKEVAENVRRSKDGGGEKLSVTHILCLLLRLRQLACDPTLCPPSFIDDIRDRKLASRIEEEHARASGALTAAAAGSNGSGNGKEGSTAQQLAYLRGMLRDAEDEDCMACGQLMTEPRITICQHLFCQSCIESAVEAGQPCPQCSWPLGPDSIVELSPSERSASPASASTYTRASSVTTSRQGSVALGGERTAKMDALVGLLRATPRGVKSLVFSQWTTHLDRIEAALTEEGISTCRFDGSMRQDKREEVIKLFTAPNKAVVAGEKEDKKNPMVMLLSLKAGALGLNLTVASQVFLMDPWWQPAIEQQAIDRVNRIGQTKDVRVFQLVADDTVEARVLEIQQKKEKLIAEAFSGSKNAARATEKIESKLDDLAAIFGIST